METSTLSVSRLQVRSNRLDLMTGMAGDLAHEVRNPLHAMAINLELIRRRAVAAGDEAVLGRVAAIETDVARLNGIVTGLLRLLRSHGEPGPARVSRTLESLRPLVEAIARPARVRVEWYVDPEGAVPGGPDDPAVAIAPDDCEHALLNVVVNALEAMAPEPGTLYISARALDDVVEIRVRDSGPGFDSRAAENFGTPGFSTKPGHAGLGTAVAKALLETAGARIELEDAGTGGAGASVRVVLPRADSA